MEAQKPKVLSLKDRLRQKNKEWTPKSPVDKELIAELWFILNRAVDEITEQDERIQLLEQRVDTLVRLLTKT